MFSNFKQFMEMKHIRIVVAVVNCSFSQQKQVEQIVLVGVWKACIQFIKRMYFWNNQWDNGTMGLIHLMAHAFNRVWVSFVYIITCQNKNGGG